MIRRILVPLDGSPLAECALPHAAAIAQAFDSELRLLRVLPAERRAARGYVDSAEWRLRRSEATAYLQPLLARLQQQGLTVEGALAEGNIEEEIIESARRQQVDLIVLSTHGHNGASQFGLGGTAAKVISAAGVSVLVVRAGSASSFSSAANVVRYERILVPVDCSKRAEWALHLAAAVARAHGAELLVAHVVPVPQMPQREPGSPREARLIEQVLRARRKSAEEYLDEVKSRISAPDLEVRTLLVVSPTVARRLEEVAEQERAGLMVLSAHGHGGSANAPWAYGSVSASVVAYGTTPLLIFQDLPLATLEESQAAAFTASHEHRITPVARVTSNGWSRQPTS
jgi:nucleotide-binding universal stress UspA family protein